MKRSIRGFPYLLTISSVMLGLTSCGDSHSGGTKMYQLPWPTSSGQYQIQRIELRTFDKPEHLKGQLASILVRPFSGGSGLESDKAVGRFTETSDGTRIPADLVTLQGTVVYAHMERLQALDSAAGVAVSPAVWPARIGIEVNATDADGQLQNNALYDGELNAMLIVPFSESTLPITLNAGVLAHEHFHALFQSLVLSKLSVPAQSKKPSAGPDLATLSAQLNESERSELPLHLHACGLVALAGEQNSVEIAREERSKLRRELTAQEYNEFLLRGLNEGLADFWGWLYTGDANFIERSLAEMGKTRSLADELVPLPNDSIVKRNLTRASHPRARTQLAYSLGAVYARFLHRMTLELAGGENTPEARMVTARALVRVLPSLAAEFKAKMTTEFVQPEFLLGPLLENLPKMNTGSCGVYDSFAIAVSRSDGLGGVARPKGCEEVAYAPLNHRRANKAQNQTVTIGGDKAK